MTTTAGNHIGLVRSDQNRYDEIMSAESVSIYEAKTHLSRLVTQVEQGEEIEITRHGRPVARLVPLPPRPKRRLGMLEGQGFVPDGWDELTPQDLIDWYGE